MYFSHEKLTVYQKGLEFIDFSNQIFDELSNYRINAIDQLDRASTSVLLNIAEGTGRYTCKDKCKFYDISRGSALECAACLDVLSRRKKISIELAENGKKILNEIVSMLIGLIKSNSNRVYENESPYNPDINEQ